MINKVNTFRLTTHRQSRKIILNIPISMKKNILFVITINNKCKFYLFLTEICQGTCKVENCKVFPIS